MVRDTGEPVDFGSAFLREFVVKGLVFGRRWLLLRIPTLLDYLWPLWDDENRACTTWWCQRTS